MANMKLTAWCAGGGGGGRWSGVGTVVGSVGGSHPTLGTF